MYVMKVKHNNEVETFKFDCEKDIRKAAEVVRKTRCPGFIAIADSVDSTRGKILEQWPNEPAKAARSMTYYFPMRRYADSQWATLGSRESCIKLEQETNAKVRCWADVSASAKQVVGPLWQVVFTDPYKD